MKKPIVAEAASLITGGVIVGVATVNPAGRHARVLARTTTTRITTAPRAGRAAACGNAPPSGPVIPKPGPPRTLTAAP